MIFTCGMTNLTGIRYPAETDGYMYGYEFLSAGICTGMNFYL
jgi:hypothetical protein